MFIFSAFWVYHYVDLNTDTQLDSDANFASIHPSSTFPVDSMPMAADTSSQRFVVSRPQVDMSSKGKEQLGLAQPDTIRSGALG